TGSVRGDQYILPDHPDGKGSPYAEKSEVLEFAGELQAITASLKRLEDRLKDPIGTYKILVCRSVHQEVRSLLEQAGTFDEQRLHNHLRALPAMVDQCGL